MTDEKWLDFCEEYPDADFDVRTKAGKMLLVVRVQITANGYTDKYEAFYNRIGEPFDIEADHSIQRVIYPGIAQWRANYSRWNKAQERAKAKREGKPAIEEEEDEIE